MPKELDYRNEIVLLDALLDDVAAIGRESRALGGETGVIGPYGDLVDAALDELGHLYRQMNADVATVTDELDRRAALCAQYTSDYRAWEWNYGQWTSAIADYQRRRELYGDAAWPGAAPTAPLPPFAGAEVG